MNLLNVEIVTKRLVLKPISMKYKENIFLEFTEEITIYMCPQSPREISETEAFIQESLAKLKNGDEIRFVILDKQTQDLLGCAGLHDMQLQNPEIGLWLKKAAHGHKYGIEVVTAIKNWADMNFNYAYFRYRVDRRNTASRKIAEALGGRVSKEYDYKKRDGNILQLLEYRIYSK